MKTRTLLLGKLILGGLFAFNSFTGFAQTKPVKNIVNPIYKNTLWSADTVYFLRGYIYVGDGGLSGTKNATLTIQPGTVIKGDTSSSTRKGALIISRGSKIIADGTPCKPIVFTSSKPSGKRNRGDWGGLILLGQAPINAPGGVANIEGIPANDTTKYGGSLPHDNSGILRYVRVEFAGVALTVNNEINGITFGGVGDGTTIDYVQVSFSNDDSFEWFGGTVNAKHLVAFRGIDDDFDTDNGFSGKIQFAVSLRDPNVADVSGSNGFESDNDANGSTNSPQTNAIFSNVDVIAGSDSATNANFRRGAHVRRNSHMYAINSIILGWPVGVLIDGTTTENSVLADTLLINNIIAAKSTANYVLTTPTNTAVSNFLLTNARNQFFNGNAGVMLNSPYNLSKPNFRPLAGSPALGAANFSNPVLNDPFFTRVSYIGAFSSTDDWTTLWTNFNPANTDYTGGSSLTFSGTVTKTACNDGAIDLNVPGDDAAYNYAWTPGGQTTENLHNLNVGTYSVTVTYAADNTCTATKSFTVDRVAPVIVSSSSTSTTATINWDNSLNSRLFGYRVRYKLTSSSKYHAWKNLGIVNTYTINGLAPGTAYNIQLSGRCSDGTATSAASTIVTTTVSRGALDAAVNTEDDDLAEVNIYPNPSKGNLTINTTGFKGNVSIKVMSMEGQILSSGSTNMSTSLKLNSINTPLDLSHLPTGLYLVEISDGTKKVTKRINIVK